MVGIWVTVPSNFLPNRQMHKVFWDNCTQSCKNKFKCSKFCTIPIPYSEFKKVFRTFYFKNFTAKPWWNNFGNFLEFFRRNFDSLWQRYHKIIEILFPLRWGRNAFWTLPNQTEVRQNHSKWLTTAAAVETVVLQVLGVSHSKSTQKILLVTKMLCIEVCKLQNYTEN